MQQIIRFGSKYSRIFSLNITQGNANILSQLNCLIPRHCHAKSNGNGKIISKINFEEMVTNRRKEAKRSILVQVNSEKSFPELHFFCSQYGDVKSAHHYTQDELHYILLEFSSTHAARNAVDGSVYNGDIDGIYVQSPFLWFRAGPRDQIAPRSENKQMNIIDGNRMCTEEDLINLLQSAETVDDQLVILHRLTGLNDIGTRLRFLAARQIEVALTGMFPKAQAFPFGSSVNGFGKLGCDLDLILKLDDDKQMTDSKKRLVFHTKETLTNGRSQTQRYMENLSDILQLFLPGICHVRRILQARVPIIKYHHEHLDLEVDLSMSNLSGVYMSELFYMFGQIDARVQPLVFAIRKWAQTIGLTNPSPGRWISNFSLTCLVIAYLQQLKQPILPPINDFIKQARSEDARIIDSSVNCTFLRDLNVLQFNSSNTAPLHRLFTEFFEFYSQLDFSNFAISLNDGKLHTKPDHSAMYIVNPLEIELNVSKNVSLEECERFRIEVRNAAWILESDFKKSHDGNPWGLLSILKTSQQAIVRPSMFFKPRMVDVSDLFAEQSGPSGTGSSETNHMQYKNSMVKMEVNKIKKKGRSDVQVLGGNSLKLEKRVRKR